MVGMPRERPGDKFGTSQGHPGRLGRFMWKFTFKGQNVRGTDRTDDGTDGTCPRDRRDTTRSVPPKFFVFIGFFLSHVFLISKSIVCLHENGPSWAPLRGLLWALLWAHSGPTRGATRGVNFGGARSVLV